MRIAVTSQNFRTVTGHAGRARRFLIFDAQPGAEPIEVERLDLPKELAMHDFHGAGPHPLDGTDAIISESFGEGFAQRMAKRGIIAVTTQITDPAQAVTSYLSQRQAGDAGFAAATCGCGHRAGEGHGHGHAHRHHHAHGATAAANRILKGDESHE